MGCPVEIEFAGCFATNPDEKPTFYLLQIRPFMEHEETINKEVDAAQEAIFVYSRQISGNRVIKDIQDIVYVKPDKFDNTKTLSMVEEIKQLNQKLLQEGRSYILIGPGRWGTNDRHLGIPVDWTAINGARVIMEVDLPDFKVDHSQGSHFFHNITSAGIPYFCVKGNASGDYIDWGWLEQLHSEVDLEYCKHVHTTTPLQVIVNGKKREGWILKGVEEREE